MAKTKAPPLNPVTDEHVDLFDAFIVKWRSLLNLRDWRICRLKRRSSYMAELTKVEYQHKLARYAVGRDFGNTKVTPQSLESTACHELLHLLLAPLIDVCIASKEEDNVTMEYEHAVIVVLEELLMNAYGGQATDQQTEKV